MKRLLQITFLALASFCYISTGCSKNDEASDRECGTYKSGQQLYVGPQGGCYYVNSSKNKEYVDRSFCTCVITK